LLACAAALVLTGPSVPMLFMGEEWGARTPWQYFTDHTDPELPHRAGSHCLTSACRDAVSSLVCRATDSPGRVAGAVP
ncbi:hypothetical protein ACFWFQ_18775, partial [Nocardia salmonicida]|uniref:hypothetical protein n=1 Tax=Nocardia salmonicida TaxID=53431 RepID=UPI003665A698